MNRYNNVIDVDEPERITLIAPLKDGTDLVTYKKLITASWAGPILYFGGAAVALLNVYSAFAIFVIVPVYFIFFGTKKKNGAKK